MASLRAFSFVAAPSPSLPKASLSPSPVRPLAAAAGPSRRVGVCARASSLSSASHYVPAGEGASSFSRAKPCRRMRASRRSAVSPRCTTGDEILAHKSVVEKDTKERMDKTIDAMVSHFNSIKTGRASPALLDRVKVEYHGSPLPLKSISQITVPDSVTLVVQPYDKSSLKMIEKAIVQNAELGLTPNNDGHVLRMTVPQPTADRRKELIKLVAKYAEDAKIAVRLIRRDAIKAYEKLEKEKKLSKDCVETYSIDIQAVTDDYIKKIDSLEKQKEKELMTV